MRPTAYRRNARGLRERQAFEGVRFAWPWRSWRAAARACAGS